VLLGTSLWLVGAKPVNGGVRRTLVGPSRFRGNMGRGRPDRC